MAVTTPLTASLHRPPLRSLLIVLAGAAIWVAASSVGHLTSSSIGGLAAFYLPVGLLVGSMIRLPQYRGQFAVAVLVGNLSLHLVLGNSLIVPGLMTAATLVEALIVSLAMRSTGAAAFTRPRDGMIFGVSAFAACVVGGLLGSAIFAATGSGSALQKFATWVPADLLGILLVSPLIVKAHPIRAYRRVGAFLAMLVLASGLTLLATRPHTGGWATFVSWYVVLLVLLLVGALYGVAALGVVQAVPAIIVFVAVADTAPAEWFERQVLGIALSWSLLIAVLAIRAELRSRRSSEQLATDLFHHSPTPTAVVAFHNGLMTVTQANSAWRSQLSDDTVLRLLAPTDRRSLKTALPIHGAQTTELRTPDDRLLSVTIHPILRSGGAAQEYLICADDVTSTREQEARLREAALTDPLTGLANRRAVFDELARRCTNPATAVLYIDLDGFKHVNDTYGHLVGDALLIEVAQLLASGFRTHDTVGRIGGDEFLVIADLGDNIDLAKMCRRTEELVTSQVQIEVLTLKVRASVGAVTVVPGELPEQTLARADAAMYRRKLQQRQP